LKSDYQLGRKLFI